MKRRVVLITCLLGTVSGGVGAALAAPVASPLATHDVCVSIAQNENYHGAHYVCVDTP